VKEGDSFSAIYNEAYIDDTTALNISSIEAAVFTHQGKTYNAIPFMQDSIQEYYDEEGKSLRKAFLKAPLDFFRITSKYTNARFHPILKRYRAHHGIDYAAPTGTPVKSIGAGVVIAKGFQGGGGNFIKIRHNSAYSTTYMHLSKFARGIRIGSTVQQGEVIAYVGSTGLSTGPHLDFRVYKNGQPINPLHVEAPPSKPVKPELRDSFLLVKNALLQEIDSCNRLHTTSSNRTIALIQSYTNLK
jgi:murein DD-endopeptidase MepM/ murein hydrolase activator NlpD